MGVVVLAWLAPAIQFIDFGRVSEALSSAGMGNRALSWVAYAIYVAVPTLLLLAGCMLLLRVAARRHSARRWGALMCMIGVTAGATTVFLMIAMRLPLYLKAIPAFVAITPLLASLASLCDVLVAIEPYSSRRVGLLPALLALAIAAGLALTVFLPSPLSVPALVGSWPVSYLTWIMDLPREVMRPISAAWLLVTALPLVYSVIARATISRSEAASVMPVGTASPQGGAEQAHP